MIVIGPCRTEHIVALGAFRDEFSNLTRDYDQ